MQHIQLGQPITQPKQHEFFIKPYTKISQQLRDKHIDTSMAVKMIRECDQDIIRRSSVRTDSESKATCMILKAKMKEEDKGAIDPLEMLGEGKGKEIEKPHPIKYLKKKALDLHFRKLQKIKKL